MARTKIKMWRNGPGGDWDCRITWYAKSYKEQDTDIRLRLEDCERLDNVFPETKERADLLWFMFRQGCGKNIPSEPFIVQLLELWNHPKGRK